MTTTTAPAAGTRYTEPKTGKVYEVRAIAPWANADGVQIVSAALVKDGAATSFAKNVRVPVIIAALAAEASR